MLHELPSSLDALMTSCIQVNDHLRARRRMRNPSFRELPVPGETTAGSQSFYVFVEGEEEEKPMQLGRSRFSAAGRHRRLATGETLYCSSKGHFVATCLARPKRLMGDLTSQPLRLMLQVRR